MTFKQLSSRYLEPISEVIMIVGILALVQPWNMFLHVYGVTITLAGFVGFVVFSHIKPSPGEE